MPWWGDDQDQKEEEYEGATLWMAGRVRFKFELSFLTGFNGPPKETGAAAIRLQRGSITPCGGSVGEPYSSSAVHSTGKL